jgi:hypothetical protein
MSLLLRRTENRDDLWAIVDVAASAFGADDAINLALFPPAVREAPEWDDDDRKWRVATGTADLSKANKHFLVVEDTENGGKIVGMAQWDEPEVSEELSDKSEEEKKAEFEERMKAWPASLNRAAAMEIRGLMGGLIAKHIGDASKDMWCKRGQMCARGDSCLIANTA